MDGEHSGLMYAQGLIDADMSDVEVMHKVRDVAFTSKKFVTSRLDRAENKDLLPDERIKMRLAEFGIPVEPVETKTGAAVTMYLFKVSAGVRMSTLKKHVDDIKRAVKARGEVRVLTPVPGTDYVGVEVPNAERRVAKLKKSHLVPNTMTIPIGEDVHGDVTSISLTDMPHLLIAGATGSGKSVAIHSIIKALTKQMKPEAMQLILIDPKRVELNSYARKKHVVGNKSIYDPREAVRALMDLKKEMEKRYTLLEKGGKRDLAEYNETRRKESTKLPYIVCVIDEFADLIMQSRAQLKRKTSYKSRSRPWLKAELASRWQELRPHDPMPDMMNYTKMTLCEALEALDQQDIMMSPEADVEHLVSRIAQLGRAAGIHLIVATQRPSVDVITGLIKANFPTRMAFTTSSPTDSQVILGEVGAEKLDGDGDMLLMSPRIQGKRRLQGLWYK